MVNLLSAHFFRLWRSRAFWAAMAVMAAAGVFEVTVGYLSARNLGEALSLDSRYIIFVLLSGIVLAAWTSLFLGAEHSQGGLRRKLAAGHTRQAVYAAGLLTAMAAGTLLCLGYIAPVLALGFPLLGNFHMGAWAVWSFTLRAVLMTAALAAVFTMSATLYANRAACAVLNLTLAYFLVFLGIFLHSRLSEPAVTPAFEYILNGRIVLQEAQANPAYTGGLRRTVYALLFDLPGCQAVQLAAHAAEPLWRPAAASLAVMASSTAAGLAAFRRKDLK